MPCLKTSPTPSKGFPSDYRARRHVNNKKLQSVQAALAAAIVLLIAACATTPPDPRMLDNARQAIAQAEAAEAREYAPLELRFANERLRSAEIALENEREDDARRLAEQAELEAQLAFARTRAALARAELQQKQRELEQIRSDLGEVFGQDILR